MQGCSCARSFYRGAARDGDWGRRRTPALSWSGMQDAAVLRLVALGVFAGAYIGLSLGRLPPFRVDRTGVAIIGAAAMVLTGVLDWNSAVASVDAGTLVLLFGMMIVAAYLRLSGFFGLVTTWAIQRARTPVAVLVAVVVAAGVLSALFVNDVICLVLAPLVIDVTRRLDLPPVPYLIALATAANVGSVATLTGNPQNMLVGSFSGISYRAFLVREAPVAILGLGCVVAVVWLVYRKQLPPTLAAAPGVVRSTRCMRGLSGTSAQTAVPLMTTISAARLIFRIVPRIRTGTSRRPRARSARSRSR